MIRSALIASTVLITGLAQPAFADWGGVAVHLGTGNWGYSAGWDKKRDAEKRAMHYCHEFAKSTTGCEVVLLTRKCGAVVRGSEGSEPRFFVIEAANRDAAGQQALAECKATVGSSCDLRRTFCASDL